jgi:hypothetical protein
MGWQGRMGAGFAGFAGGIYDERRTVAGSRDRMGNIHTCLADPVGIPKPESEMEGVMATLCSTNSQTLNWPA